MPLATGELRRSLGIAWTLAVKTLENRYARSALGLAWLLLTPVATILVYWGVFGLALGVEWPQVAGGPKLGYIVPFMAGLAVYLYFSDIVTSSLNVFVSRRNYVRKSPVPLWVLWMAGFMGSSIVAAVNLAILLALALFYGLLTPVGIAYAVPVILLIVLMFAAVSLLLALVGPFAGDLGNGVPVVLRVLFYAAPITYPLSILPASVRPWLWLNPLTAIVEMLRETLVLGRPLPWLVFSGIAVFAAGLTLLAHWLYGRVAEAVRDVV
jgi:lipopolysaccharide transport system permease protein